MPQLTFAADADAEWRREAKLVRRAVDVLGGVGVAAAILGVSTTQLGNALAGTDRHFPAKWLRKLLRAAGPEFVREYIEGWVGDIGCELRDDEPLTDAEFGAGAKRWAAKNLAGKYHQDFLEGSAHEAREIRRGR